MKRAEPIQRPGTRQSAKAKRGRRSGTKTNGRVNAKPRVMYPVDENIPVPEIEARIAGWDNDTIRSVVAELRSKRTPEDDD